MPIPVSEIVNRATSALDAEGSDRYRFDQDFMPAINYAIEWSISVINEAFAQNKLSGEALRELNHVGVFQANNFSRIAFNPASVGKNLWTIIAVYPLPTVFPYRNPVPDVNPVLSKFIPDISMVGSNNTAKRLTQEEWNDNAKNVFMPGNNSLFGDLVDYAYLDFSDYSSLGYNNGGLQEIEVRPSIANKYAAIAFLEKPALITSINDDISFPESMTNIITEKTLSFISYKQGDGTNLYGVTAADINKLTSLIR